MVELASEAPFRLGILEVDPPRRLIRAPSGAAESVEPKVMQVLLVLARSGGAHLSRDELRRRCWGGRATSDDAVDRIIARIRRLGEGIGAGSVTLETVPKVGYRLWPCAAPLDPGTAERAEEVGAGAGRRDVLLWGAAAGIAVAGGAIFWRAASPGGEASPSSSLAVLPVSTAGNGLDSFAAALADDLRGDLGRMAGIRVAPARASERAAALAETPAALGRRLGAGRLVDARLGAAAGQVELRIALLDAASGREDWSTSLRLPAAEAGRIRILASGALLEQVAGTTPLDAAAVLPPPRRPDPQAYALAEEGTRLLGSIRTAAMRGRRDEALGEGDRAAGLAARALAIDPGDAGALLVEATLARNGWTHALAARALTTEQRIAQWLAILRRALVANPDDPRILAQLGDHRRRYRLDWDGAETLFGRALAFDPGLVEAHWSYGYMLGVLGRAVDGLDHALTVYELDPERPFRRLALPRLLYVAGDRANALRLYRAEQARDPDNLFLLFELYLLFLSEGSAAPLEALLARTRARAALRPDAGLDSLARRMAAGAEALRGRPGALRAILDSEFRRYAAGGDLADATPEGRARDDLPYVFGIEYAWAGAVDRAIEMFGVALAARSLYWPATLPYGNAPLPAAVRGDPRYRRLWQRGAALRELVGRRRRHLLAGRMAGFTAAGRPVLPQLPEALKRRRDAILARLPAAAPPAAI